MATEGSVASMELFWLLDDGVSVFVAIKQALLYIVASPR